MKKLLIVVLAFIMPLTLIASNSEKRYTKLIEKYDIAEEAKCVDSNSSKEFWETMLKNNEVYGKFLRDILKKKGAEKEAIKRTAQLPRFYPQYEEGIIESMQGFCDTLLIDMGISDLGIDCSLHMIYSDDVNAFTALTETGFAMCVTSGLFTRKGVNYDILMGYVAHEFVHGVLEHHIRGIYEEAKRRRKDELIAGIATGLTAAAAVTEAYVVSTGGMVYSNTNYEKIADDISINSKVSTAKYTFNYLREQEYEADLIAYRFLENLGLGEEYINGLRILGSDYDFLYDEYSDHPTTVSRINFLKFVKQNSDLGNTSNLKIKKKRMRLKKY